jgi:hypothetical protein
MIVEQSHYQFARCLKDGKLYAFDKNEYENVQEDYSLIPCLPINEIGEFQLKEIFIYWKDLIRIK